MDLWSYLVVVFLCYSSQKKVSEDTTLTELLIDLMLGENLFHFNQSSWRMTWTSPLLH